MASKFKADSRLDLPQTYVFICFIYALETLNKSQPNHCQDNISDLMYLYLGLMAIKSETPKQRNYHCLLYFITTTNMIDYHTSLV